MTSNERVEISNKIIHIFKEKNSTFKEVTNILTSVLHLAINTQDDDEVHIHVNGK